MEELSAVVLLQRILDDGLERGCSDIHLHLSNTDLAVHFRINGHLHQYLRLGDYGASIIRRIKALARMDVAESRLPQDGSFTWESETRQCDVRAACVPTVSGETMVLRLLPQQKTPLTFTSLGMTEQQAERMDSIISHNSGLVLVAGPTGAGKTTTLYAMMLQLTRLGRRVVSIEDPVEMALAECQQIEVRERIGVTFDAGLRAVLRQDPDVIMVGEIRDELTARVAMRAALTGHLVLSTTHATDVVGAAARLVDFGISRAVIGDVLRGVVVQKLTRTGCSACGDKGCPKCEAEQRNRDRTVLFDIQEVTFSVGAIIASEAVWPVVRQSLHTAQPRGNGEEGVR